MRKQCSLIIMSVFVLLSFGCTFHQTQNIANSLDSKSLYPSFRTEPINLSPYSKCDVPLALTIINDEKREEDYLIFDAGSAKHYINPKELTNHIVNYMTDALEKSNVKNDLSSKRQVKVSLQKVNWIPGMWAFGALVAIRIEIPEIKYTNTFSVEENSMAGMTSTAYAIHVLTWNILSDPIIKDYILCKNKPMNEKPS